MAERANLHPTRAAERLWRPSDLYNNRLLPLTVGPRTFLTASRQTRKDISYRQPRAGISYRQPQAEEGVGGIRIRVTLAP